MAIKIWNLSLTVSAVIITLLLVQTVMYDINRKHALGFLTVSGSSIGKEKNGQIITARATATASDKQNHQYLSMAQGSSVQSSKNVA